MDSIEVHLSFKSQFSGTQPDPIIILELLGIKLFSKKYFVVGKNFYFLFSKLTKLFADTFP